MSESLGLFAGFGVELEYMIVDRDRLDVLPACDQVLHAVLGAYGSDADFERLSWSNELALHVIELKTNGPAAQLAGLADAFTQDVRRINEILRRIGGRLLPTAAHPWMDPFTQTRLWPHDYNEVYEAFDRVFSCRGHGWSNLQSTHLNLPFANDEEFGRLHAAIRLLLPILPALAASSPLLDGRLTGFADARLECYRKNSARVPQVAGVVIPEPVFTREAYEEQILAPLYRAIAPFDPEGTLQYEWLNARGAIARFMRNTIEIRVLDIQECPQADLAIVALIVEVLRGLCEQRWSSTGAQQAWSADALAEPLLECIRHAENALLEDGDYLKALGVERGGRVPASAVWQSLYERVAERLPAEFHAPLRVILFDGTLSTRIRRDIGGDEDPSALRQTYAALADCLNEGRMFQPAL